MDLFTVDTVGEQNLLEKDIYDETEVLYSNSKNARRSSDGQENSDEDTEEKDSGNSDDEEEEEDYDYGGMYWISNTAFFAKSKKTKFS